MKNIMEIIKARRSVRSFDGREIEAETLEKLKSFSAANPYGIPVEFRFLDAKEHGLTSPVVSGTEFYAAGKLPMDKNFSAAFGYSFELFVLYAWSLGIGTVWMGGTMNRDAFEKAMEVQDGWVMPCSTPLGYGAKKMSVKEVLMRKGIKADSREDFEKLFFENDFKTPLTREKAGELEKAFEAVRLAPSAVNKQPWRIVVCGEDVHLYLKRSKGFMYDERLDMQMIDIGIAMCHFDLAAKETGLNVQFMQADPEIGGDMEYVASYKLVK